MNPRPNWIILSSFYDGKPLTLTSKIRTASGCQCLTLAVYISYPINGTHFAIQEALNIEMRIVRTFNVAGVNIVNLVKYI